MTITSWDDVEPYLASMIDSTVESDGWRLLEDLIAADRQRILQRLSRPDTSWEDTNRLRGEIAALDRWSKTRIHTEIRHALGGPDVHTRSGE